MAVAKQVYGWSDLRIELPFRMDRRTDVVFGFICMHVTACISTILYMGDDGDAAGGAGDRRPKD